MSNLFEEWKNEPDFKEFTYNDEYKCEIRRSKGMGNLCGYVYIHENHPSYNDQSIDKILKCHGGITFKSLIEEKKVFIIGFDCAHAWDLVPYNMLSIFRDFNDSIYRNIEYVEKELCNICEQLDHIKDTISKEKKVNKEYYIINFTEDGDIYFDNLSGQELEEKLKIEDGCCDYGKPDFLSEFPENLRLINGNKLLILKGEIIIPKIIEVIKKYSILGENK